MDRLPETLCLGLALIFGTIGGLLLWWCLS